MIYGSWLPFVVVVSLVYAIFLLFTIIGLIYSKTKKQFFVFNYLKSENINIPIKKRKIYQISAISLKNNSIKTYINIKKPVSLLSFIFVLKKVYFFKCKKEGQYFFYPILSYLLILVIIIQFVLVYFHESINLKYFKWSYEKNKAGKNSYRGVSALFFLIFFNPVFYYSNSKKPDGLYKSLMTMLIKYYDNENMKYNWSKLKVAILTSILIDYLLMHFVFIHGIFLNIKDKIVRGTSFL